MQKVSGRTSAASGWETEADPEKGENAGGRIWLIRFLECMEEQDFFRLKSFAEGYEAGKKAAEESIQRKNKR